MNLRSLAPLLACAAAATTAHAAEVTLYEHANFVGARMTLRATTPNFAPIGFNDRVSSLVVTSGRWELCTDAEFRGSCTVFAPGQYPTIDPRLNDRFSSAREIGGPGERRGAADDRRRGLIELFERSEYGGASLRLDGDVASLSRRGFDDRAASVVVKEGAWELCTDENFQGECRSFPPGSYADLSYGFAGHVSSARLLGGSGPPVAVAPVTPPIGVRPSPRPEAPPGLPSTSPRGAALEFFSEPRFRGDRLRVERDIRRLDRFGFDDRAASVVVLSGTWEICTDVRFGGSCAVYRPGRYPRIGDLTRQVSSVRRVE